MWLMERVAGGGIALQSLYVKSYFPSKSGDCSFEVFCSAWPTSMDGEGDRDKWRLASPPHHGRQRGPGTDHTFGNGQHGRYLHFSAGQNWVKSHYFQSENRPTAKCMSFWFFCTKGTSRLIVQEQDYYHDDWQDVWDSDLKDAHLQWTYAFAMLSPGYFREIRIMGVTYTSTGVVAIDDIRFHNASCPEDGMKKHGAVVKMSDWNLNHFAELNSHAFCPTRDAFYFLVVNYTVNCEDGMCMLAVVQRALNNSAVFLWNTTEYSNKIQTQKIKIASRDDYFWITIGARKINTYGWSLEILVDSVSFEFGGLLTTAETTTTLLTQQSTISASPDTSGNRGEDNSDNGLAVGVGVSMAVIVVVVVVITVIVCRRRNNSKDGNKDGNAGLLNCWKNKSEPASESIQPGVANATYAPDSDPDSVNRMSQAVSGSHDAAARHPNTCATSSGYVDTEMGSISERSRDCEGSGYITLDDATDSTDNQATRQASENMYEHLVPVDGHTYSTLQSKENEYERLAPADTRSKNVYSMPHFKQKE
ncbi:hypothetical protein BaRGS_00018666, partial [Batillaria attramentaria]